MHGEKKACVPIHACMVPNSSNETEYDSRGQKAWVPQWKANCLSLNKILNKAYKLTKKHLQKITVIAKCLLFARSEY